MPSIVIKVGHCGRIIKPPIRELISNTRESSLPTSHDRPMLGIHVVDNDPYTDWHLNSSVCTYKGIQAIISTHCCSI